jgi:hypothetical protein
MKKPSARSKHLGIRNAHPASAGNSANASRQASPLAMNKIILLLPLIVLTGCEMLLVPGWIAEDTAIAKDLKTKEIYAGGYFEGNEYTTVERLELTEYPAGSGYFQLHEAGDSRIGWFSEYQEPYKTKKERSKIEVPPNTQILITRVFHPPQMNADYIEVHSILTLEGIEYKTNLNLVSEYRELRKYTQYPFPNLELIKERANQSE